VAVAGSNARDGATDVGPRDASLDAAAMDALAAFPEWGN
jgi:hypothetical protein